MTPLSLPSPMSTSEFEFEDHKSLLGLNHHHSTNQPSPVSNADLESPSLSPRRKGISDFIRQIDRRLSGRRLSKLVSSGSTTGSLSPMYRYSSGEGSPDALGEGAPPEWALLLIGCLLGLATGICVAAFNGGVSFECRMWIRSIFYCLFSFFCVIILQF